MISRLIALLLGKPTPESIPVTQPLSSAQSRYGRTVAHMVSDVRRCDSIEQVIAHLSDRSGYVREAAVERAVELGSPMLLPALAGRLNDWVIPVRNRAQDAVLTMLAALSPETDADVALQLLPEVQRLKDARRADHSVWIADFERRFITVLGAKVIVNAINGKQPGIAQSCFELAATHALADTATLCRQALANRGNVVLPRKALELARGLPEDGRQIVYRQALNSHVGAARAEALRALLPSGGTESVALAESMLMDSNTWVRRVASAFLARTGVDVPGRYAERIAVAKTDLRTRRACLAGLAESGGKAYLDLIGVLTVHDQPRVQVAAFLAWIHLSPKDKDDIAQRVLRSPYRRVRKLFAVFSRKLGAYVPVDVGLAIMRKHGDYDQMPALVQAAPWTTLEAIAIVAGETRDSEHFQHKLSGQLAAWLNSAVRGYTQPTAAQREYLLTETVQQTLLSLLNSSEPRQQALLRELHALEKKVLPLET